MRDRRRPEPHSASPSVRAPRRARWHPVLNQGHQESGSGMGVSGSLPDLPDSTQTLAPVLHRPGTEAACLGEVHSQPETSTEGPGARCIRVDPELCKPAKTLHQLTGRSGIFRPPILSTPTGNAGTPQSPHVEALQGHFLFSCLLPSAAQHRITPSDPHSD